MIEDTSYSRSTIQGRTKDTGLQAYMSKVYGLMSIAMVVTGLVSWFVGSNEALIQMFFAGPQQYIVMFAPLVMVFFLSFRINKLSLSTATVCFYGFATLIGISISAIMIQYTGESVVKAFMTTSVAFLGLSLYGYTTKRDLGPIGNFLIMGVIGLVIASVINLFTQSNGLSLIISGLTVLIFAGLTAYDTQKIKNTYLEYAHSGSSDMISKMAIMGALNLYLDFLNMFLALLRLFGERR